MGFWRTVRDRLSSPARGVAGFKREPMIFDEPPAEPVELDGDIPWELREDDGHDERS